ncbi:MAG: DUF3316 domain-containing protein [Bacteroidales bacterium]
MNFRTAILAFCMLVNATLLQAQKDSLIRSKQLSVLFGYGNYGALETYLSPYKYSGTDYRLIGELSAFRNENKLFLQHTLNLNYSKLTNFSGRGLSHVGMADYTYGRHYKVWQNSHYQWFVGPSMTANFGAIYNVRNDNNPVQVKAAINLNLSSMEEYRFKLKSRPITVRYEFRIPMLGAGFAPEYGASYYEMFQLGNTKGIVHFLSLHNQLAMQNCITVNVPIGGNNLRVGYYNNYYQTRINSLETSLTAHNFVLGYSGEIFTVAHHKKGKR